MHRNPTRPRPTRDRLPAFQSLERRVLFAAGDLDTTFGGDGVLRADPADITGRIAAIAVQADGKTVAVGSETPARGFPTQAVVLRYNANGSPDASFGGGDGIVLFDRFDEPSEFSRLTDVEILPNGDIVAAGTATEKQPDGLVKAYNIAVRVNSTGAGVPTFGAGGLAAFGTAATLFRPRVALDALPSGEVFIAGQTQVPPDSARAAVIKLTPAGTVDTTFGSAEHPGMWRQPVDDSRSASGGARDVQAQPNGRILVAGDVDARREAFVVRLTASGSEDATFGGGDGTVWLDLGRPADHTSVTGNALALQGDGKIVLAGHTAGGDFRGGFRITRLNSDGSIDTPFGDNGLRPFTFAGVGGMPTELKIQPDGKVVAAGFATRFSNPGFVVGRLEADGDMDYTFGDRGRVYTPERVGDRNMVRDSHNPVDMDMRPDGKIVTSGNYPFPGDNFDSDHTPVFARYLNDGGTVPPPTGDGVTVQAENGGPFSGAFVSRSNPGYTGSGYVDYSADSGGSATWNVGGLQGPGDYVVEFRYANGSSSRTLQFEATPGTPARNVTFAPTGGWTNWSTLSVPATVGGAGDSLAVVLRTIGQNGPNIDTLTVRKLGTTPPPAGATLQAEQATVVGAQVASNTQGYTGTGFVDFLHGTGDSVEWSFNDAGGRRTLSFRYANGSSDRPLELRVNGQVINPRLSFAPTGNWNTWREVSVTVDLAAGNNRVKLTSVGSNGGNIDALTVR